MRAGADTSALGRTAERIAEHHLNASAGLELVERNFRAPGGEIDLIMRDGDTLVFVEVRYRRGTGYGGPAASIDRRKRRRITATASRFLQRHPRLAALACRFDVVAVSGDGAGEPRCEWLRGAFDASGW